MQNLKRMWALLGAATAVAAVLASSAAASHKAGPTIVIWTDANRAPAITKVANAWASSNGATISVVQKNFGDIETQLGTVASADAPDIVLAAHDWTGQLAANGLVVPLYPSAAVKAQFPSYTLNAFSYGTAVKKLYGIPVQVENIGLLVNTKLTKVPTTFAQVEATALSFKKRNHLAYGICVQQGSGGDAYHMYPFFSGLGGFVFGTNSVGNLDPSNIGVANKNFLKNAKLIDKWNKEGLINSKVGYSECDTDFTKSKTPYWITGPWADSDIEKAGISFKVVQLPKIVFPSVPFLGVNGMMVTKYAAAHGVDAAAKDLVLNFFSTPSAQTQLAAAGGRAPANIKAKATDPILAEFGKAGKGGVPMPNIPQMASVWTDLGAAWVRSTKGAGAMPAVRSFTGAAKSIADKIG
ncbi:MAG TPA: extracellular solute-binding protein [Gaiellaceae bacterium]|nr:extracellular solute-binding protein [Gaiellaceae bacterium]